ncbi:MAG: hypothetical protein IKB82_06280 [Clostridia bacterium]|nr:hypothetical protein [Clostridia bacterium]
MPREIILTKETQEELACLSDTLGVPQEAALFYALRLVNAVIEEGLLPDVRGALCTPQHAQQMRSTGTQGKVLDFKRRK